MVCTLIDGAIYILCSLVFVTAKNNEFVVKLLKFGLGLLFTRFFLGDTHEACIEPLDRDIISKMN